MLAAMSSPKPEEPTTSDSSQSNPNNLNVEEFLSTGRTGRRNALPDILGDYAVVSSSDLPMQLEGLTTKDNVSDPNKPGTSKDNVR